MKYYLIPIEELRFEDDDKMMQIFLKNVFPTIYRKYKENYAVNSLILKELEKNIYQLISYFKLINVNVVKEQRLLKL